ncbi:MAG: hypothetical protein NTY98_24725, partial [Verrucomicrobia bacterium]|nr:hypothetical protein [Verrucomicrobiota bacterium]
PIFTATDVLKGNIGVGKGYGLDSPSGEVLRTIPDLIKRSGTKPFLLVARFDQPSQKIWPVYGASCVWPSPQDLPMDARTPASLQECIAFAASVLKLPVQNRPEVMAPKPADVPHQPLSDKAATAPALLPTAPVQKESAGVALKVPVTTSNEPVKASMPWLFYAAVIMAVGASLYFLLKKRR